MNALNKVAFLTVLGLMHSSCAVNTGNPSKPSTGKPAPSGTTLSIDLKSLPKGALVLGVKAVALIPVGQASTNASIAQIDYRSNRLIRTGESVTLVTASIIQPLSYDRMKLILNDDKPMVYVDENNKEAPVTVPPIVENPDVTRLALNTVAVSPAESALFAVDPPKNQILVHLGGQPTKIDADQSKTISLSVDLGSNLKATTVPDPNDPSHTAQITTYVFAPDITAESITVSHSTAATGGATPPTDLYGSGGYSLSFDLSSTLKLTSLRLCLYSKTSLTTDYTQYSCDGASSVVSVASSSATPTTCTTGTTGTIGSTGGSVAPASASTTSTSCPATTGGLSSTLSGGVQLFQHTFQIPAGSYEVVGFDVSSQQIVYSWSGDVTAQTPSDPIKGTLSSSAGISPVAPAATTPAPVVK